MGEVVQTDLDPRRMLAPIAQTVGRVLEVRPGWDDTAA